MKHAAVALDYEQRIASLEADNRAMGQAIMEMAALIDILRRPMVEQVQREARKPVKACQAGEKHGKFERQGGALASPTLPHHHAAVKGQAS